MIELHFTVVPSNFSSSHLPSPPWNSNGIIPAVVLSLCFFLGVPGNIAVILLKPNWKNMSSLSQSLMLNLAISDLLCLLTLPLWIYTLLHSWTFGMGTCKLLSGIVYCSVQGSQMTVFAMSIQRYVVVVHCKSCKQVRKGVLLGLIWLVAVILSIPTLVLRQLKKEQEWTHCQLKYSSDAQKVAVLLTEATVGLACISLVAFSYINVHRKVSHGAFFNNRQTTRLITSITVCFCALWVPYHITNVLGVAAVCLKNDFLLKFCEITWNITGALSFVNSCINPFLYTFTSKKLFIVCFKKEPLQLDSRNHQTPDILTISEP